MSTAEYKAKIWPVKYIKARLFLLVDLREIFFRSRVGGGDEKK